MIKLTPKLIVQALVVATALARLFATAQASSMPAESRRRAQVLQFKGKDRRKP